MNVEDVLQHYGVKGMKWGVRRGGSKSTSSGKKYTMKDYKKDRKAINKKYRNKELTKSEAMKEIKNNVHKVNMNNAAYRRGYDRAIKRGASHKIAVKSGRNAKDIINDVALDTSIRASEVAISKGRSVLDLYGRG